jgi:hypothetical protein
MTMASNPYKFAVVRHRPTGRVGRLFSTSYDGRLACVQYEDATRIEMADELEHAGWERPTLWTDIGWGAFWLAAFLVWWL